MDVVGTFFIAVFLLTATVWDSAKGIIPNKLNMVMGILGLIYGFFREGKTGVLHGVIGIWIPFIILYLMFVKRVIGAGDIKLFSALGAWFKGEILWVMVVSFIIIALYGLFRIIVRVIGTIRSINSGCMGAQVVRAMISKNPVHLSFFIMLGTFVYMVMRV